MSESKNKGRGTRENPTGRFESLTTELERMEDPWVEGGESARLLENKVLTEYFLDTSKTVVSTNDSPDIGFEASVNPYRGCEHGCIYCYARPTHEYLGYSPGMDFESRIFIKKDAPKLLREKLSSKSWKPQTLVMSGVTDLYQPIERKLQLTRQCLEVLFDFRNPVSLITKNYLVTRDLDLFREMTKFNIIHVSISLTTLRDDLVQVMEPRTSRPQQRLKAIRLLSEAGIPVNVMMAPIIPGLTDHEIPAVLKAAKEAGARTAHYTLVRLPHGVKDLFENWLEENFPGKKEKILNRLRETRGGKLYNAKFGERMRGSGPYAEHIRSMFGLWKNQLGLNRDWAELSTESFRRVDPNQLSLFD